MRNWLGQLIFFSLLPQWAVLPVLFIGAFGGVGACVTFLGLMIASTTSAVTQDLHEQCDSAVGPDPSATMTTGPNASPRTSAERPLTAPTANPYAELTIAPDDTDVSDWYRACAAAMKSAPYQHPSLLVINGGATALCARDLAQASVGSGTGAAATLSRYVIYRASAVAMTGRCEGATAGGTSASEGATIPVVAPETAGSCALTEPVLLPKTVAGQGICGQRVDLSAVSAGDLVFWDYRDHAPTRVGVALGSGQIVSSDPTTDRITQEAMPTGSDVRVKRVLGGAS
ncbi:hypothetical protein ACFVMC_29345 [Nocardia sp. NPDC127579]|uniref:hypothetical protein n=1 Tax=Nocardia sp. NPDC127579 TaxID=3345402 RepID=UPI00363702B3